MVTVATYRQRFAAEHALGFLTTNGVDALMWGDDAGGLNPALGFIENYELRVHPEQESLALELLADFGLGTPGDEPVDS